MLVGGTNSEIEKKVTMHCSRPRRASAKSAPAEATGKEKIVLSLLHYRLSAPFRHVLLITAALLYETYDD